ENTNYGLAVVQGSFATWECRDIRVTGGTYARNGYSGIYIFGNSHPVRHITIGGGAILRDNGTARTGGRRQGIALHGTVSDVLITGNWIGNTDSPDRDQVHAVQILTGTFSDVLVADN